MAIVITQNSRGSRMQKLPNNWLATESFIVTGTFSKSAAIDAVVGAYPTHPDNPLMKINPPIADNVGLGIWRVTADYNFFSPLTPGGGDALDQPSEFFGAIETISVPMDRDIEGNPIVNSAGDPIEPGGSRQINVFVLAVERNIPNFSVAMGLEFTNSVNISSVTLPGAGTWDPGQGYCRMYAPISGWKYGDPYVRVRGEFAFRRGQNPWDFHPKDQGHNGWYDSEGNKRGVIVAENGDAPGFDVALDGTGKPLKTQWKIQKVAGSVVAPIANPDLPPGLIVDTSRSNDNVKFLEWLTEYGSEWSELPF